MDFLGRLSVVWWDKSEDLFTDGVASLSIGLKAWHLKFIGFCMHWFKLHKISSLNSKSWQKLHLSLMIDPAAFAHSWHFLGSLLEAGIFYYLISGKS